LPFVLGWELKSQLTGARFDNLLSDHLADRLGGRKYMDICLAVGSARFAPSHIHLLP
jgi:hypothetical protein